MILALGILSLLFVLVGTIVLRAQGLVEHDDFPSYEQYYRFLRVMGFAGSVVIGLGVFLLAMVGLITSIRRDDLPESLRRAFLVASMAVLTTWLVFFGLFGGWPYLYP